MASPDTIVVNARLWDRADLDAESLAIADGRILATGSNREMNGLAEETTNVIDAGGRRVMPGLIDSHLHLVRGGRTWDIEVRWDNCTSLSEAIDLISSRAEELGAGAWVGVMGGWHPNQFAEHRLPTTTDLDRAAPHNPVFVQRAYAECFVNTRAMEVMGWGPADAPGGNVTSPAHMAALRARLTVDDIDLALSGTAHLFRELNSLGVTGAIDASGFGITAASYDALMRLFATGERGFRARLLLGAANPGAEMADIEKWVSSTELASTDEFVRHLGAGEVLDYAAHDMEGLAPKDIAGRHDALSDVSAYLASKGWPVHLHSILDTSIDVLLDAWESVDANLSVLRWAICHADQISARNLDRVRDLGVGITVQNGMSMRGQDCEPTWGTELVTHAPPVRSMLDRGIPVAAGSDALVACSYNPWRCIAWLVTGRSIDGTPPRVESERLDRDEALRLYTSAGAWFSFEEDTRGTLRDGAHADFVVLSADPLTVSDDAIADIESVLTVVAGEPVYDAS